MQATNAERRGSAADKEGAVFRLDGKAAIVTGGGSGIGREISLMFARQGALVAVADVNEEGAARVAEEITAAGGNGFAQRLDVTSAESAQAAVDAVVSRHGRLDILVNNAGIGFVGNVIETGPDDLDKLLAVNVKGVHNCTKAAVTQMIAQDPKGGRIVNIGSVAGMVSVARRFAYCATKGAVLSMTQSVAMDFIDQGIRCNSISPGTIESPFVESYLQRFHAGEIEETRAQLHARQPIGRMGRPDEIAPLALYLVSDESGFVTGANYVIDGGLTAK
jgi:NAD(P)-dependent dehydrogenase (short-subunit alcohol dehydrogenase family)